MTKSTPKKSNGRSKAPPSKSGGALKTAATAAAGIAAIGVVAAVAATAARKAKTSSAHDDAPGRTARRGFGAYSVSGRTVTINRPRQELFAYWRDFQNLAGFMDNLDTVTMAGPTRSTWTIKAPAGRTVDIETEIAREEEGKLIAWRSVAGSDIDTEGRVEFADAPGERGTRVTLIVSYKPPAGAVGKAIAKLFLREPEIQSRHDLKRFKMLMETGEIATGANRRDTANRKA